MARIDRSREALLATTASLLRRQGYAATGLAQVTAESGTSIGSLYHHFPDGKEALAEAALDRSGAQVTAALAALIGSDRPVNDAVRRWLRSLAAALAADERDGCPVAPAALESVHASARVRAAADRAFTAWRDLLAERLVLDGRTPAAARADATAVLALVEGALLLARTSGERSALDAAAQAVHRVLADS